MQSVFPIAYFGNIEYFRQLVQAESPVIETKEHFVKQTVRTRCEILSPNGIQQLNIPVFRKFGSKTLFDEVELSGETDWRKIHWRSIKTAYSASPYFDHYGIEVEELINQSENNLLRFNVRIMERIIEWLELPIKLDFSKEYLDSKGKIDFRLNDFKSTETLKSYKQVFSSEIQFIPNLSILDLIFCEGPIARKWIV